MIAPQRYYDEQTLVHGWLRSDISNLSTNSNLYPVRLSWSSIQLTHPPTQPGLINFKPYSQSWPSLLQMIIAAIKTLWLNIHKLKKFRVKLIFLRIQLVLGYFFPQQVFLVQNIFLLQIFGFKIIFVKIKTRCSK